MSDYSTKTQISDKLVKEVTSAVKNVRGWGSVEIHIQNFEVIQITERNIRKTHNSLSEKPIGRHIRKMGA